MQMQLAGLLACSILNAFPLIKLHKNQQWRGYSKPKFRQSAIGKKFNSHCRFRIADSR